MARFPYLKREDAEPSLRAIYDQLEKDRGTPPGHVHQLLGVAPNLLQRFTALGTELRFKGELDPQLRELAILTVGRITNTEYEFVHHWNIALRIGVAREKLESLADFERSPNFDEKERAVMRYAIEVTQNIKVGEATFNALRAFLDNRRMMELATVVAFYNAVVRILLPFEVELEPGYTRN